MTKVCGVCKELKPIEEFRKASKSSGDKYGYKSDCILCSNERSRKFRATEHGKILIRGYNLKKFNLTINEYDEMLKEQLGVCYICHKICQTGKRLAVDHDHNTGKLRKLLCQKCNTRLGDFENWKDKFEAYLQECSNGG